MASNFNVHHNVNELMKMLEIEENVEEGISADSLTDKLLKSIDHKSKTRGAAATFYKKLEGQSDPEFKAQYDQLKVENVIELDPMVHLLSRILDDKQIRYVMMRQNQKAEREHDKGEMKVDHGMQRVMSLSPSSEEGRRTSDVNNLGTIAHMSDRLSELDTHDSASRKMKEESVRKRDNSAKRNKLADWKFLTLDYKQIDRNKEPPVRPLSELSVPEQESALIEDLLFVLVGVEGRYICLQPLKDRPTKHTISIDNSGDELLLTLATRITSLCCFYSQIIHFIEEIDRGLVNQALAAAMRDQIKDYFMLIAQLEMQHRREDLTLQKMWYLLQPCFTNLEILRHFAHQVAKGQAYGGAVLSILHEKTISLTGNTKSQEFCLSITKKASESYLEILEKWIHEGVIDDPYKEFFVEDRDADNREENINNLNDCNYWENRYNIVRARIPIFLERHADAILNTGKYLSVIRQCGRKIPKPEADKPLVYTTEERIYIDRIESAYRLASKELLHLLMDESDLIGRLHSIKHYFLMDQGDFIVQFMDLAGEELDKEIDDISPNRLDSLLELSLRTSIMNADPYKDDVGIELLPDSLLTQMSNILNIGSDFSNVSANLSSHELKGFESLALKFVVAWPLSLILNARTITEYQMLFRHLFYCKYVERQLEDVWKEDKVSKRFTLNAQVGYAQAFALRQKMLYFVQNLEYYIMVEVIEPNFHQFLESVQTKVTSVDDMINHHRNYIDQCLQDSMISTKELLELIVRLLRLCITYSEFMKNTHRHADQYELLDSGEETALRHHECQEESVEPVSLKKHTSFEEYVGRMHDEFNSTLHQLLEVIKLQSDENYTMLVNVLHRLDFNAFYAVSFV